MKPVIIIPTFPEKRGKDHGGQYWFTGENVNRLHIRPKHSMHPAAAVSVHRFGMEDHAEVSLSVGAGMASFSAHMSPDELRAFAEALVSAAAHIEANPATKEEE